MSVFFRRCARRLARAFRCEFCQHCCFVIRAGSVNRGCLLKMKIDTPVFRSIFTPEVNELLRLFRENRFEIRLAGGPVRDLLLGKRPKDLDFATDATPDDMKRMFEAAGVRMVNSRGEKHGTVTPRIFDKENFEVTTLRIDVTTDGRHAEVQFTNDWELDAGRRDLTINSMFLGLDGTLYDYFNGAEDLKRRRIAFVGDPVKRIQEDYLRILRYFRFFGRIADGPSSHDEKTIEAIRENVGGLKMISGERIWSELRQILVGNHAGELFSLILAVGCAPFIGFREDYDPEEIFMIWNRLKDSEYDAITLAASALKSTDEVMDFHERLKLSRFERDLGLYLVINRRMEGDPSRPLRPYQLLLADAKREKYRDILAWTIELMKYRGEPVDLIQDLRNWQLPVFPVSGSTLMNSVPKGKMMSKVLQELRRVWKENDFKISEGELKKLVPGLVEKIRKFELDKPAGGDVNNAEPKKARTSFFLP